MLRWCTLDLNTLFLETFLVGSVNGSGAWSWLWGGKIPRITSAAFLNGVQRQSASSSRGGILRGACICCNLCVSQAKMIVGAQFLVIIPPVVTQCPEWYSIARCDFTVCASLYTQINTGHHKHLHIVLTHIRRRRGNFRSPKRKGGDKRVNGPTS